MTPDGAAPPLDPEVVVALLVVVLIDDDFVEDVFVDEVFEVVNVVVAPPEGRH